MPEKKVQKGSSPESVNSDSPAYEEQHFIDISKKVWNYSLLSAEDVVQEVQVFDKRSDQAEFTGIDDGVKDKTINLKMKEDKKSSERKLAGIGK